MTATKKTEIDPGKIKKPRGRVPSGKAKTSTVRSIELEKALIASGGRILGRVRLNKRAAEALENLSKIHATDKASIEFALIKADEENRAALLSTRTIADKLK